MRDTDYNGEYPDGIKLPKIDPSVQALGGLVAHRLLSVYDSLMTEILSCVDDNPLERAGQLLRASKRLTMLLSEVTEFRGLGTEIWIQGTDIGPTTSSPELIKQVLEEPEASIGPEDKGLLSEIGFHIPPEDGIQCFFDSFTIGPVFDATSDDPEAIIPYALGLRVSNSLVHPADPNVRKLFIPGLSTIVPVKFEELRLGVVV